MQFQRLEDNYELSFFNSELLPVNLLVRFVQLCNRF